MKQRFIPPLDFAGALWHLFMTISNKLFKTVISSIGRQNIVFFQSDWHLKKKSPSHHSCIETSSDSKVINCYQTTAPRSGHFAETLIAHLMMAMTIIIWSTDYTFVLEYQLKYQVEIWNWEGWRGSHGGVVWWSREVHKPIRFLRLFCCTPDVTQYHSF